MLRPFKVKSKTVRVGDKTAKGYHLDEFEDAFARHLPEESQASQASQPASVLERDVTDVTDVTLDPTPVGASAWARGGAGCDVHRGAPRASCRYCRSAS